MSNTQLVMLVGLFQKGEISSISILTLPFLNLLLHVREVGREPEPFAIAEPDIVIGVAFDQLYTLGLETGTQIAECMVE